MRILVLNAGSSSLKYDLFETEPERQVHRGGVERVGSMMQAFATAFDELRQAMGEVTIDAVGHRIVHGGEKFLKSVIIDAEVEREIEALGELAPLHNPHNLEGVRAARERLPAAPQIAAFDTAFHHRLPARAYVYGLPWEYLTGKKIRRYGFHGLSHCYISERFAELRGGKPDDFSLISCHLGNGCSICAIDHGRSVDTSMGFTPLEGLVMGTRSGDIDAGAILHLITHEHEDPAELRRLLNSASGLRGIAGGSGDMRDLELRAARGDERAQLAIDIFCYRAKKYIGGYLAALGTIDALVFTGGIGENSETIRNRICSGLEPLGIGSAKTPVCVIPTNEELLIARDTKNLLMNRNVSNVTPR